MRQFNDFHLEDQGVDLQSLQIPLEVLQALAISADPNVGLFTHVTAHLDLRDMKERAAASISAPVATQVGGPSLLPDHGDAGHGNNLIGIWLCMR